jgi:hypothetical protein
MAAAVISALLLAIVAINTAAAYNVYADYFITLSARPLAMGGASAAVPQPASVFSNPAGLAVIRQFALLYNHSGRHFPGSQEGGMQEWDQLDGDTEALIVPLPLATYAHGFTFSGELGYDYRGHPADGSLGYPRERVWGTEDYDALAFSGGLPVAAGYSLRRSLLRYTPEPGDTEHLPWLRHGEGEQWGILAPVWPGLLYGHSKLKHNYDWTLMAPGANGAAEFPEFGSKHLTTRSGWALRPTGWLTLARDQVSEQHIFDKRLGNGVGNTTGLFAVHMGNREIQRQHHGGEFRLGSMLAVRWGNYDGHPTWGAGLNLGGLWLNYSEVQGLLPRIVGAGHGFENIHIYGAETALP